MTIFSHFVFTKKRSVVEKKIAKNRFINTETFADVAGFRDLLWREGFYLNGGELHGVITQDGVWSPTQTQNSVPIPTVEAEQTDAWERHHAVFHEYLAQLARRQIEARAAEATTGGQ